MGRRVRGLHTQVRFPFVLVLRRRIGNGPARHFDPSRGLFSSNGSESGPCRRPRVTQPIKSTPAHQRTFCTAAKSHKPPFARSASGVEARQTFDPVADIVRSPERSTFRAGVGAGAPDSGAGGLSPGGRAGFSFSGHNEPVGTLEFDGRLRGEADATSSAFGADRLRGAPAAAGKSSDRGALPYLRGSRR